MSEGPLHYLLKLDETDAGTGYFSIEPLEEIRRIQDGLQYLESHPFDGFMRDYLLKRLGKWETPRLTALREDLCPLSPVLAALFDEIALLFGGEKESLHGMAGNASADTDDATPFIYIKAHRDPVLSAHGPWIRLFEKNMRRHEMLPSPQNAGLPLLYSPDEGISGFVASLEAICSRLEKTGPSGSTRKPAPEETARRGLERLEAISVLVDEEKRHTASLSPVALLRQWHVDITVHSGRHWYRLEGNQTSYGRGIDISSARAACVMEIVERLSSFAPIEGDSVMGLNRESPLLSARFSELSGKGLSALDPNRLFLETPYRDEPLWWMEGRQHTLAGLAPILVPVQCVFLFSNLDEIRLFSGLGSTGLASGNTLEEAKVSALLEIIERDSEAVSPFSPRQCFSVETSDNRLASLFASYQDMGIHVYFQDLTQPMGVPCCKCFVIHPSGQIVKGAGAHLNARRALVSALTETPYPYPYGPPSRIVSQPLLRVPLEKLPDYSTGDDPKDLHLIESLLLENGSQPIYVDLTRKDLGIPVVRAIIPGMDILGDFGPFSRVHPRLFANYVRQFQ